MSRPLRCVALALPALLLLCGVDARAEPTAAAPKATGKLCEDVATLLDGAKGRFPGVADLARPTKVDGDTGWQTSFALPGATSCWVAQPDPQLYPDARSYRCDLGAPQTRASADKLVKKWQSALAVCPSLKTFAVRAGDRLISFEKESGDNHIFSLHLILRGDPKKPQPALAINYSEI